VILDPTTSAPFKGLAEHVELCDEAGKTLGFFLPPDFHHEVIYAWAKSLFTDEDIERSRQEYRAGGGLTTAEAVAYLERVARDARGGS
jgi:hypothetical protein